MTAVCRFDFASSLRRIRDARSKRGTKATRQFINAISRENRDMPTFNPPVMMFDVNAPDADYSNEATTYTRTTA